MARQHIYRIWLQQHSDWMPFLRAESRLPGPRSNLELAAALAAEGDASFFQGCLAIDHPQAVPANTPDEFIVFCGLLGTGRVLAEGALQTITTLQRYANDPRWRLREGVAIALQTLGDQNLPRLLLLATDWSNGSLLECRAAIAAICEPRLLRQPGDAPQVFGILDTATARLQASTERKTAAFEALRKGLAYCWSVAICGFPEPGKTRFAAWFATDNRDIRHVLKENLGKQRLKRLDPGWVESALAQLG